MPFMALILNLCSLLVSLLITKNFPSATPSTLYLAEVLKDICDPAKIEDVKSIKSNMSFMGLLSDEK